MNNAIIYLLPVSPQCHLLNGSLTLKRQKKLPKKSMNFILLNFSGSDWCGPCMRLRKEILIMTIF